MLDEHLDQIKSHADPERAKFYGDIQEKLTAITTKLLFYALEFNRLDDAVLEEALKDKDLAHYGPWIDDLRKEKPYQLSDEVEKLFHEKSISGRGAWNRLFNETMTALRFDVGDEELSLEPTLNRLTDTDGAKRREAAEALAGVLGGNLRLFTHITNTLSKDKEISDRWRGFEDVADSRHLANRVEREVVDALVAANALIADYAKAHLLVSFVDIDTPMIGDDGRPRKDLFLKDGLHLNEVGYKLWSSLVRKHLTD